MNNFRLKIQFFVIAATMLLIAACGKAESPNPIPTPHVEAKYTQEQILSIGIVSDDPAGSIKGFQPMVDFLAKQLKDQGIQQGKVVVTADFDTMDAKIQSGDVDLFYETAYGGLYAYENAGAIPLLRGWRNGIGDYHSLIFVRKDSGVASVEDLKGKLIAFADASSTSGYFLPKAYLISSGINVSEKPTTSSIPSGNVGYIITGSDENVVSAVMLGKAVGGALEYDAFDDIKQADKDQLTVLVKTKDVPRSFLMASPKLSAALRDRIVSILKAASQSDEGKEALKGAKKTTGFDDYPLGPEATMKFVQDLFASVK